jgi:uncharacterized protein (DUF488 family)
MKKAYSFGYSGKQPEDLLKAVGELGAVLCDIRLVPYSRWHPGWNKKRLASLFGNAYIHVPELGNLNYKSGGPIEIADINAGLQTVLDLLKTRSVILMCVCKDPLLCHRAVVSGELLNRGVEVEELMLVLHQKGNEGQGELPFR